MLRLYQSNQLESLVQLLCALFLEPLATPLQQEVVVVQHPGMARWLSQQIASQLGICGNLDFPLPASYIWRLFKQLLPEVPPQDNYQPKRLAWRIFAELGVVESHPEYAVVTNYLSGGDDLRRFQLAQRLAILYDRYLLYRPDWVLSWQEGRSAVPGDGWQAALWRRLTTQDPMHWVSLQQRFYQHTSSVARPKGFPSRVSIFGVPTLSPGYLEIVRRLASWMDVHLFLLNPCEAHWAEIVTPAEKARLSLGTGGEELYLDVGHPLLASMGRQGRDFFAAINEMDPGGVELFQSTTEATLLQQLQNQILNLQSPESGSQADQSISFHLCHSPMREVEVLYDQLLGILDELPGLRPNEILVMTPEIDRYAPLVEAVFSTPGDRPSIPFRISGASLQQSNLLATALLEILTLPNSRYGVAELISLLELPPIRMRFGLDEAGLEKVTQWLDQAAIRWGRDGESKLKQGLPPEERNTWKAGLQQLMLGYALPVNGDELWHGIYPLDAVEGSSSQCLGGVLAFCDAVFQLDQLLQTDRSPQQWLSQLIGVTEQFFFSDDTTEQMLDAVRESVHQVVQEAEQAGFDEPVPLSVIRHRLKEFFDQSAEWGFLGGGVNICALAPMRSLPFRVIYLMGMNDGAFPRQQQELGFDLMKGAFRAGDRSRRVDDRYLFLETLISAQDRLLISYQGRNQRDNSLMPASVVVDELRDCLHQMLGEKGVAEIIHHHPLQPFSTDYFREGTGLFSYSPEMREAAMELGRGRGEDQPLVRRPLEPSQPECEIELDELQYFFENPQRGFVRERVGLSLEPAQLLPEEREIFSLESFSRADFELQLVDLLLQGSQPEKLFERFHACGVLPHGNAGQLEFRQMLTQAQEMAQRIRLHQREWLPEPLEVDLSIEHYRLRGHLRKINQSGLIAYSTSRLYPYQLITQWIRHLVLNQLRPQGVNSETWLFEQNREGCFKPVERADHHLEALIQARQRGLISPLPFYPGTSWVYVEKLLKSDEEKAFQAAHQKWFGNNYQPGDVDKVYNRLLNPHRPSLGEAFSEISLLLFQPLMEHLEWR
jgi:exodeoxyribonuclease V gamma subunit